VSVWTDFIAINETEIVRLQLHFDEMAAGTLEMRALDHGKWVLRNAEWASEDRSTIERLTAMVARAKAELGIG
jgi:hypothetical protein